MGGLQRVISNLMWCGFGIVLLGAVLTVALEALVVGVPLAMFGLLLILFAGAIGGVGSSNSSSPVGIPR